MLVLKARLHRLPDRNGLHTILPECLFMLPNRIPQLVAIDPRPFMEGMEVALLVGGQGIKRSKPPVACRYQLEATTLLLLSLLPGVEALGAFPALLFPA